MKKLKTSIFYVLLIFILLFITIILFEISLLLFNKYNETKLFNCREDCLLKKKELIKNSYDKKNFISDDKITFFKKILDNTEESIVVTIPPLRNVLKDDEIYPLSGIANSKTIFCNELGFYSEYFSDMYGFNNLNKEYSEPVDYLLIGDSFTHGACVKSKDNFKGNFVYLSNNQLNFINLGYQGTGTLHQFGILREYFQVTKPKTVIQFYFEGNDLSEISEEMLQSQLKKYILNKNYNQKLINNKYTLNETLKFFLKKKYLEKEVNKKKIKNTNVYFQYLVSVLKLHQIRSFLRLKKIENENLKNFTLIIKKINFFLKQNNTNFIFVYLPDYQRYKGNLNNNYKKYNKIIQIIEENNIKLIDVKKNVFDLHSDPLSLFPFRLAGHYNNAGYKIVSEYIFSNLTKLN